MKLFAQAIVSVAIVASAFAARAETVLATAKPTSIPVAQAAKSKTPFGKCDFVHTGPNGNPVKVKASKTIFTAALPKEDDKAGDLLADGKSVYRCKSMEFNHQTGRMISAD